MSRPLPARPDLRRLHDDAGERRQDGRRGWHQPPLREPEPDCDVIVLSVETPQTHRAAELARTLRAAGPRVVLDVSERRLDRKLRNADRLGARIAVIVGEEEMRNDDAVVRDLAEHSQQRVPTAELAATVARLLETAG